MEEKNVDKENAEKSQEEKQEIIFKLSMYEQQIQQIQQQLDTIERELMDLSHLNLGLDDIKGKEGEEIFASIGKGIYARAKLVSEDMIMDVGGKNFAKKKIPEIQEIITMQTKRLEEVKEELRKNSEEISREADGYLKALNSRQ